MTSSEENSGDCCGPKHGNYPGGNQEEDDDDQDLAIVPPEFLLGKTLIPKNFDMPEKPIHGEIVNRQLKSDLFHMTYNKVKGIMYSKLDGEEDYFMIKKIQPIDCEPISFQETLLTNKYRSNKSDHYLGCEQWTIDLNGKQDYLFKVKVLQSVNDHFYSLLFPPTKSLTAQLILKFGTI